MKILHLSTTDLKGGAAIAAMRLHRGLVDDGVESLMYVQRKYGKDIFVISSQGKLKKFFDYFCAVCDKVIAHSFGPKNYEIVSPAIFSSASLKIINKINPDVVNVHWICGGFFSPEKISKIKKPVVWTMHDAWPFSGVNHYNADDKKYLTGDFKGGNLLDRITFIRKKKSWNRLTKFVANSPSKWLAKEAKNSYLFKKFKIENIPNGIDTNIFKQSDKAEARKKLNLPLDKKLLLFGAVNPLSGERKGYKLLIDIIRNIKKLGFGNIALVVFGTSSNDKINFGLPTYFIGKIYSEEEMSTVYSAADIFIAPSLEDNLPNIVIESMSCGTPVAAFNIGGMPDMIDNGINGVLVPAFDTNLIAKEILAAIGNQGVYNNLSLEARKKVLENFNIKVVVNKYKQLYLSILK